MKKKGCLLFFILLTFFSQAQKSAVTETGEEVMLYPNGTWKFLKEPNTDTIKTNTTSFKKNNEATFLIKSDKTNIGIWLNPKKWSFKKAATNQDAEFELSLKGESLQAMILTESTEIPLESFKFIALENGKKALPDLHVTNQEYRIVNGLKILYLQMEGSASGLKLAYSCYYFSGTNAAVQFLVYTYPNLKQKYLKEIDELLNGIVKLDPIKSVNNFNTDNDSLSQGSMSPYNDCKKLFTGNWEYDIVDKNDLKNKTVLVKRTLDKTYEYTENGKYIFEYENVWIDKCKYDIIFRKTTKPNYSLMKIGEKIEVEIIEINKNEMRYSTIFRGETKIGEMRKAKLIYK